MESSRYLTKWLRASIDSLHVFGLAVGVLFFAASLTPSLLPRPTWIQGVLSGVVLSVGYGLGVLCVWIWKYLQFPVASARYSSLVLRGASGRKAEAPAVAGLARTRVAAYVRELERTFFEERQIDGAAARLGLSRRRFTTLFREIAGDTWFNTVRAHRLAHARRLLRETGRSVTSICYECGFEDVSSFYRAFRTAERASPDAWRKRLAPDRPSQVPR